jgi:hypothetical protein
MTKKRQLFYFVLMFLLVGTALSLRNITAVHASPMSLSESVQIAQTDDQQPEGTEEEEEEELDEDDC